jgi:hypothetical protein
VRKPKTSNSLSSSIDLPLNEPVEALPVPSKEPRRTSVSDDWNAWLPEDKAKFFDSRVRQLEAPYTMLTISLSEAMELRNTGQIARARQTIAVMPSLCMHLVDPLYAILRALKSHAKKRGTVPNIAPVDERNFLGTRSKRFARFSSLLSRVLLNDRSLFLNKVSTLEEMIGDLFIDIRIAANKLASHSSIRTETEWIAIESAHYDLNTCLREAIIVLKSFLVAMPDEQLEALEGEINRAQRRETENEPVSPNENGQWTPLTSEEIIHAKKAS